MKNVTSYCFFACLFFALFSSAAAQTQGSCKYGDDKDQVANCVTVMPNGRSRIAGFSRSGTLLTSSFSGYLLEESTTQFADLTMTTKYTQGSELFNITSIQAHPTNGTMVAVANSRPGNQTHSDGVFMDLNSVGTVLHSRIWNSTGDEFPKKIKILADGSFAVVGRIVTNGVPQSFITRLAAPSSYAPIFHRVIGKPTSTFATVDEAIAVEQYPDGRLLVAGTTHHFSRTAEGSIYLAVLALDGTLLEYHTYQIEASVFQIVAKDMALLSDGSVVVVGNSIDPNGAGTSNGIVLKVAANLLTATCFELNQPGATTRDEELRAVVALPTNGKFIVAGTAEALNTGVLSNDGLLARFDNLANIEVATVLRGGGGLQSDEFFNDVMLRDNNTIVQAAGTSNLSTNPGLQRLDVFTFRVGINLAICSTQPIGLQMVPKAVSHITPNAQSTTTMSVISSTLSRTTVSAVEEAQCHTSKMDPVAPEAALEEAEATTLFPNPATGSATLRIADLEGSAAVQVLELSGRIVQQLEVKEAETQLDLTALASGIYMVHIQTDKVRVLKKLVVQ